MKRTRLGEILFSLPADQKQEFSEFARLSSFQLPPDRLEWLDELLEVEPEGDWPGPDTRFPNMSSGKRNNWSAALRPVLYQFLTWKGATSSLYPQNLFLMEESQRFRWEKNYQAFLKAIEKDLEKGKGRDIFFHAYEFAYYHLRLGREKDDPSSDVLGKTLVSLKTAYLENVIRLLTEAVNRRQILMYPELISEYFPAEADLAFLEKYPSSGAQMQMALFQLMNSEKDDTYYRQVEKLLEEDLVDWQPEYLIPIIKYLMNYCVSKINHGDGTEVDLEKFARSYLKWVEWRRKSNLLLEEERMISRRVFSSSIQVALIAGQAAWASSFLASYGPFLEEEIKEDMILLSESLILFHQREFGEVQTKLAIHIPQDIILDLSFRKLRAKVFVELADWDSLETHIRAFQRHLRRKDIVSESVRNLMKAFCTVCLKLSPHAELSKSYLAKLKEKVIPASPSSEQAWLRKKLEERAESTNR